VCPALALPLTDDDWEALEDFLDQPGGPDFDAAAGFLTAVVTAPSHIPPSEWIPMVLGARELQGQDDPNLALVLRMFNRRRLAFSATSGSGAVVIIVMLMFSDFLLAPAH
jgi:uncharacterized protein YecA (UPF0149 family)